MIIACRPGLHQLPPHRYGKRWPWRSLQKGSSSVRSWTPQILPSGSELHQSQPWYFYALRLFPSLFTHLPYCEGSYGIAPYVVHKVANDLNFKLEANPDKFLRFDYLQYLNDVREQLAEMVNVKCDEIVLVPNASVGINTILRNFEWEKDDIIICCVSMSHLGPMHNVLIVPSQLTQATILSTKLCIASKTCYHIPLYPKSNSHSHSNRNKLLICSEIMSKLSQSTKGRNAWPSLIA